MRGKKRPMAERIAAVAIAEVNGAEAASEATGIPRTTIAYWLDRPEFVELRQKTREEMRDGFRVIVHKAQERLEALVPIMEPRDLTILLGVATDKGLLLAGDATTRTETRTWTDDLNDTEKQRLRDWIDSLDDPATATEPGEAASPTSDVGAEVR